MALHEHTLAPYRMYHLSRPYCPTHRLRDGDVIRA